MDTLLSPLVESLQARFGAQPAEFRGEVTLVLAPDQLIGAAQALRDEFGFKMMIDGTAVDYFPQTQPRFHLVYHLLNLDTNLILTLRVPVAGDDPHSPTLETVYPGANWYEREVWDLFGIRFDGHSDMRRIIMPPDWQGHPLRKDYPLHYEEVQFSFNADEINARKPYAKE